MSARNGFTALRTSLVCFFVLLRVDVSLRVCVSAVIFMVGPEWDVPVDSPMPAHKCKFRFSVCWSLLTDCVALLFSDLVASARKFSVSNELVRRSR